MTSRDELSSEKMEQNEYLKLKIARKMSNRERFMYILRNMKLTCNWNQISKLRSCNLFNLNYRKDNTAKHHCCELQNLLKKN